VQEKNGSNKMTWKKNALLITPPTTTLCSYGQLDNFKKNQAF